MICSSALRFESTSIALKKLIAFVLCVVFLSTCYLPPATADDLTTDKLSASTSYTPVSESCDDLTKRIIAKEIELERFNLNYYQETTKTDRFKSSRYFLLQETNLGLLNGGFLASVAERSKHISSPQRINIVTLEHALVPRIIGPFIGMSASLLELGLDEWRDYKIGKTAFSPQKATSYVLALRAEIDELLHKREDAARVESNDFTSENAKTLSTEGAVLKDIKDLLVIEFERFHIGTRSFNTFEKSLYVLNASTNAILAGAEIIPMVAAHRREGKLDGPAAVLAMIVGGMFVVTPLAGRAIGKISALHDKHSLEQTFGGEVSCSFENLSVDESHLAILNPTSETALTSRLAIYESQSKCLRERLDVASAELRAGRRIAAQNVLAGALVGGTVIGSESAIACAGFQYPNNARRFNVLADAGSIGIVGGLSIAMLDNLRIHTQAELNKSKLKREGELPSQTIKARLAELAKLERALN